MESQAEYKTRAATPENIGFWWCRCGTWGGTIERSDGAIDLVEGTPFGMPLSASLDHGKPCPKCGKHVLWGERPSAWRPVAKALDRAATPEPPPEGQGEVVLGYVVSDLAARAVAGEKKYGTLLRIHNGRDPLWDAYQEAIDMVMYLRQAILERDMERINHAT